MKKLNMMKIIPVVFVLAVVGGLGFTTYYFYNQYKKVTTNPSLVSQQEARDFTAKISKYMELPTGEDPTLATVTDKDKLKDQPFFARAENGDKVLIYTKARKAILYRVTTNKVIEVAPLTIGTTPTNGTDVAPSQTQKVRVAIYNGSTTVGLSKEMEKKVLEIGGMEVTSKINASKNNYSKTIVVDLSGKMGDIAGGMAQILGGELSASVPTGEVKPDADILVIAAK